MKLMKIYELCPQKNIKRLTSIITVLFFGGALIMVFPSFFSDMPFRWIFQIAGMAMLGVGVFLTARFVMKSYIYRIESTQSGADLTVTEMQGRSITTVCRLSLSGIEEVCGADTKDAVRDASKRAQSEGRKIFNYCADIKNEKVLCIFATECGEEILIKLSYDEELERQLGAWADDKTE